MIAFFLLLFMLDIQHPPKPDNPFAGFVVTAAADNSVTSGCTMNPGSGNNFNADMISVDQLAAGPQNELPLGYNNPLPLVAGVDERNSVERFIWAEGFRDGTASSPNPDPEPPTAATALQTRSFGASGLTSGPVGRSLSSTTTAASRRGLSGNYVTK